MANTKLAYGGATNITCTLASLATAGVRECTAVDNSANLYLDAMLYIACALQAGSTASDKVINIYFYGSADGTNYTDNATGSDAAVTLRDPSNLRGPFVIAAPTAGALTYKGVVGSVAQYFGGVLPYKWGFAIENRTNITFSATESDHTKQYLGVYATGT